MVRTIYSLTFHVLPVACSYYEVYQPDIYYSQLYNTVSAIDCSLVFFRFI